GQADADLAGELRMRARCEGGELLVADLRELDLVADLVEGAQDPVDPVAWVSVDALDAPLGEALEHELAYVHARGPTPRAAALSDRGPQVGRRLTGQDPRAAVAAQLALRGEPRERAGDRGTPSGG